MKKLFILLLLFCAISTANAQIQQLNTEKPKLKTIGQVGGTGWNPFMASLEYFTEETGSNRFILTYNDITYKQLTVLKSISFIATDDDLTSLYNLLKARIDDKKGEETTLKIGDDVVLIVTDRSVGMGMIYLSVTGKGMFALYNKTLKQLFGRD